MLKTFVKRTLLAVLVPFLVSVACIVLLVVFGSEGDAADVVGWFAFGSIFLGMPVAGSVGGLLAARGGSTSQKVGLAFGGLGVGIVAMWIAMILLVAIAFSGMEFAAVG